MNNIKELIKEAHDNTVDNGFYDCPECGGMELVKSDNNHTGLNTCSNCNGTGIDTNKNIGELLMLIVSELGEALEAHRNNRFAEWKTYSDVMENLKDNPAYKTLPSDIFNRDIKDTLGDEMADVYLRLLDLCGYLNIVPNKVRGFVNWRTENTADRLREISIKVLNLNPDYPQDNDFKTALGFVFLYLDTFCNLYNIPIEKHIIAKMAYNKTRPYKHGKEY